MRLKGCLLYGITALVSGVGLLIWAAERNHPVLLDPVRDLDVELPFRIGGDTFRVPMGYFSSRYIEKSRASETPDIDTARVRFWFSDLSYEPKADLAGGWDPYPAAKYSDRQGYNKYEEAQIYFWIRRVGVGDQYVSPCQRLKNIKGEDFLKLNGVEEGYCSTNGKKILLSKNESDEDSCEFYQSDGNNQIITDCLWRSSYGYDFQRVFVETSADERGYYFSVWMTQALMSRWDEVESKISTLVNRWRQ